MVLCPAGTKGINLYIPWAFLSFTMANITALLTMNLFLPAIIIIIIL